MAVDAPKTMPTPSAGPVPPLDDPACRARLRKTATAPVVLVKPESFEPTAAELEEEFTLPPDTTVAPVRELVLVSSRTPRRSSPMSHAAAT